MNTVTYNSNNNYVVGLVLYHPEAYILERLDLMSTLGLHLYIYDNSPFGEISESILKRYGNVHYITAGNNVGLARSLSVLCATAYAHGHRRLLFLDQDTGVSDHTLGFINECSRTLTPIEQGAYAAISFSGKHKEHCVAVDAIFAISSGSLFTLDILMRIGWHNNNYFVDCVDYEFCLRSMRYGYKIRIVYNTPDFDHLTEQPDRQVCLCGKTLSVRRYAFARIKDSLFSYIRLLGYTARIVRLDLFALVIRSMLIYLTGQVVARLTVRRR
jgi:rhamnosyltransferase